MVNSVNNFIFLFRKVKRLKSHASNEERIDIILSPMQAGLQDQKRQQIVLACQNVTGEILSRVR